MEETNRTEKIIAEINKNKFFKEFSYSNNNFRTASNNKELEFADNVVFLENILFLIQIKDRNPENVKSAKSENNWFKDKVLTKGKKQIEDTLRFLNSAENVTIINERNHKLNITRAQEANSRKIIIYSSSDKLPKSRRLQKFCTSDQVGFINLFNSTDYKWICEILFTPTEIDDYLSFREKIISDFPEKTKQLPEQAILGQFLGGNLTSEPSLEEIKFLQYLDEDPNEFSIHHLLNKFPSKIEFEQNHNFSYSFPDKTESEHYSNSYYKFISEFALLTRTELKMFKERLNFALTLCESSKLHNSSRFVAPRRGIGFIIVPLPLNHNIDATKALRKMTLAHKYDSKIDRCIGATVYKDKKDFIILWDYIESIWKFDKYWDDTLKEFSPLSEVKTFEVKPYKFKE